jgi:CheY-like chemotaxis protein
MSLQLLIVDDNAHFLEAARDLLEQEGMAVVALASTSAEAVERVAEFRPDVALVDIDLGEESGFDLATRLTQPLIGPAPRVVLISAYAEQDLHDLIEDSPAVGFLSKADLSAQAILQLLAIPDRGRPEASS